MLASERILQEITSFVFIEDQPAEADCIFIPGGSWPELPEAAAALYHNGFAPLIIPTGKFSYHQDRFLGPKSKQDIYCGAYRTEWELQRDVLIKNGVPESAILCENQSTHTVDNAFFTRKLADELHLEIKTAIICCKSFHARRCLMTYGWAFPDTELIICPCDIQGITRDNWHQTDGGRERVLSEISKCGSYFRDVIKIWSETR